MHTIQHPTGLSAAQAHKAVDDFMASVGDTQEIDLANTLERRKPGPCALSEREAYDSGFDAGYDEALRSSGQKLPWWPALVGGAVVATVAFIAGLLLA